MANPNDTYTSPLASRNASEAMLKIWSPRHKFDTWRRIWLAVAEAQQACGLEISDEQIVELRAVVERGITDEEIARAGELERELRHDVMAHVHCLGESCPKAKPIIHLGCTSQDVVCNGDLISVYAAIGLVERKVARLMVSLGQTARQSSRIPTLGFTHYQSAQPTTVGKRLGGYIADLNLVITRQLFELRGQEPLFRGMRGATGTQASFLKLFDDDEKRLLEFEARVLWSLQGEKRIPTLESFAESRERKALNFRRSIAGYEAVGQSDRADAERARLSESEGEDFEAYFRRRCELAGFYNTFDLTGQTYPRVFDAMVLGSLSSIASVLHKAATDIRLLSNRKEIDEPFGAKQIGSSAMPYKRNPMRCERVCGLTRFVMNLVGNAYDTAATQWLERTLDDSSNRRLSLPEAFLALDGALDIMHNVASGLVVHEAMVRKNLMAELPFLATENILMEAVKAGGDRQELHERIRVHAQEAGMRVKQQGLENDLIERLRGDEAFAAVHHLLTEEQLLDPMKYVGRSPEQVERFLAEVVEPLRERYAAELAGLEESEPRV